MGKFDPGVEEEPIVELRRELDEAEARYEEVRARFREAVRVYVDEEGGSPTRLGNALGVARNTVHLYCRKAREARE